MKIFFDTSVLVAAVVDQLSQHSRALEVFANFCESDTEIWSDEALEKSVRHYGMTVRKYFTSPGVAALQGIQSDLINNPAG